jgi:uncharacterized protein (TIGR02145 family)
MWMAENLNFNARGSVCYGNDDANCAKYGRLYDWATVMGFESTCNSTSCASQIQSSHRGICPVGWHVPSDAEWTTLTTFVGSNAGTKLKSTSGWHTGSGHVPGTDDFGFSALPGGNRWTDGSFNDVGAWGNWWSATEDDATIARNRSMVWISSNVDSWYNDKMGHFSVRCLQDVRP